ncbi:MAG: hypothetical protein AVDCRST_MAG05-3777, partial [uncultured Rubrobacteraceae bacterium]
EHPRGRGRPGVARGPERRRRRTPGGSLPPRCRGRGTAGLGPRPAGPEGLGRAGERPPRTPAHFPARRDRGGGGSGNLARRGDRGGGRDGDRGNGVRARPGDGGRDLPARRAGGGASGRGPRRARRDPVRV